MQILQVPYNRHFSAKYNAHINVEYCKSIKAVKYLNKYLCKGADRAQASDTHACARQSCDLFLP